MWLIKWLAIWTLASFVLGSIVGRAIIRMNEREIRPPRRRRAF